MKPDSLLVWLKMIDRRRAVRYGLWGAAGLLALALLLLAAVWPRCRGGICPSVEALEAYQPPQASEVVDREGKLVARLAPEQRIVVPIAAIPRRVSGAFIAVEDQRFYQHHGIDWHRVFGALWHDLRSFSAREGSSTITMQLARNVFPQQIGPARTLRRKLWELVLAREIERKLPKDRILELYLNQIYLGNGLYGVEAAARGYFGKSVRELTTAQAATLAALPKAPFTYDPRRFPDAARKRRDLVLRLMRASYFITPGELRSSLREKLRLAPPEQLTGAPWYVAQVRRELHDRFGPDADTMGLRVYTGLDTALQRTAERELGKQIAAVEKRLGVKCAGDPDACLEGLFVALDPSTGEVRAIVGGRDYALSEFDRVVQARRQAGSAFKPIVWAAALQSGIPLSTLLVPSGGDYQPADRITLPVGPMTLREALRVSSNRAAVALGQRVGYAAVTEAAHACGIGDALVPQYPSSFLGAADVMPLELVAAFAPFANGGDRVLPRFIDEVRSATGEVMLKNGIVTMPALQPGAAFIMASLLSDVVARGTGAAARAGLPPELPVLGKTGTTNGGQDVWFVAATPDLVAGAWMGFDHPRPLGAAATGGRLVAPVWGRVIGAWQKGKPLPQPWQPPEGLEARDIDTVTGGLAIVGCPQDQVSREWFLPGTAPNDCPVHAGGVAGFLERTFGKWFR
jgi:penicillin-binding protein 1A